MPFDALILNYKLLNVKECSITDFHKDSLKNIIKINHEDQWDHIFMDQNTDLIVIEIYNNPVHVVLTKAAKLWKKFHNKYFKLNPKERKIEIFRNKNNIIEDLEKNYMKKYIGDLTTMTYYDLLKQCTNLMTYNNSSNWIHTHYEWKMKELLKWVIGKYHITLGIGFDQDTFNIIKYIEDNKECYWTKPIFNELLSTIDIDFFLKLCKKNNLKPVNFIPIIDENLEYWFTLDILWYSETINAVTDYDIELTILPFTPYGLYEKLPKNTSINNYLLGYNNMLLDKLNTNENVSNVIKEFTIDPLNILNKNTELIRSENIMEYIKGYAQSINVALCNFIFQTNMYKSFNESVENYIPSIIQNEDSYITIKYEEITFINKENVTTLLLKFYEDSSKIKMEIPLTYSYNHKTIFCIYYNYKQYCWMYPIQEDKDKLIQCNKLQSWIMSNLLERKNKFIYIKQEELVKFEKCTKISNKNNLYVLFLVSKILWKIYIWLYDTFNINFLGSTYISYFIDLLDSYKYIDKFKKIEIDPIIRSCEHINKNSLFTIYISVISNSFTFLKMIVKIKIPYQINIPCKPIFNYHFRLDTTRKELYIFISEYQGIRFMKDIYIKDYPIIDISLGYNEKGYYGDLYFEDKKIGTIEYFEKKFIDLLKKYSKPLTLPIYLEKIVPITKRTIFLTPEYEKFLNIIHDYNPIYYNNKISAFF